MPAVASCARPHMLSTRLARLVAEPMFIWLVHYHLDLSELPDNFMELLQTQSAVSMPTWFRTRHVRALQEAGFRVDYFLRS